MFTVYFLDSRGEEIESYELEPEEKIWECLYVYESGIATDAKVVIASDVLARNGEAILYFKKIKHGKKYVWTVKE